MEPLMLFSPGQIVATPGAIEAMERYQIDPTQLLGRHLSGDWGDLDAEDKRTNDSAVQQGLRLLSAYGQGDAKLWIITEADRSTTIILRPDEY